MQAVRLWMPGQCQADMQHNIPSLYEEMSSNHMLIRIHPTTMKEDENMNEDDQIIDNKTLLAFLPTKA